MKEIISIGFLALLSALTLLQSACADPPTPAPSVFEQPLAEVRKVAETGDLESIHALCYRYKYGDHAKQDFSEAMRWCRLGAELGADSSQVLVAEMYFEGQGVERDDAEALRWYKKAADQGHVHALYMLSFIYAKGRGVEADPELALKYLKLSAARGYPRAIEKLAQHTPAESAASGAKPCVSPASWEGISSITMTAQAHSHHGSGEFELKLEQSLYEDGSRLISTGESGRVEVIWVRWTGQDRGLSSTPQALRDLGEVGMIFEVPVQILQQRFGSLCDLAEKFRYVVDFKHDEYESVSGELVREGASVHFVLHQKSRDDGEISATGTLAYDRPLGLLPTDIPIEGWTIFPLNSTDPDLGKRSTFRTLGEFQKSLRETPIAP